MSKLFFQADWPAPLKKQVSEQIAKEYKAARSKGKKRAEKEMQYRPGKLSPLDYLVLKVLHGQFGENSHPAIPIAIGMARKSLSQIKRLLSHGSL